MRIILTHEQADFDALASLLGAHLIDEGAVPVLPRRMNRNVRAFVTLYGMDLPFVDPRDLSGEPIENLILVDTQSTISVKGMSPETKVQVIDHHPKREDINLDWKITTEDTGATATLFVETLRERDTLLNTVQATLLLLGIYEDTGSLTYSRDLHAAAFLLERGASLSIAADFLNHPLSIQQQALYDRLRKTADTYEIHGHTVLVACGDAKEVEEELSTVAHKLRDLVDSDALILLVTTDGGVQLIARSTSDNIDVSEIAEHFGGGGHERAAAGLIKDRDLESVCAEMVQVLPDYVHPAITVGEIMSRGPQLLSPDTSVQEAAERMQRYGYEGYPVVEAGPEGRERVIGLLTRRAVDRALSHKLNLDAARLMEAGEHTVHPADSIEHLQDVMTETGWGQIPVTHPVTGRIIGIVTRTDLLKTLTSAEKMPGQRNLSSRLETALPASRLALLKAIAREAHELHDALYIVGGFVRDLLLERPSQDLDLVVEGDAIRLARALERRFGGRVTSHERFGTAKWHIASIREQLAEQLEASAAYRASVHAFEADNLPDFLDLISARTEFYTHPTALPTVERGSIKLDLHRRDFTINTLALRLDGRHYGELHDYWGGLNDLNEGLVDTIMHPLDELGLLKVIHPALIWDSWLAEMFTILQETRPEPEWGLKPDSGEGGLRQRLAYILWMIRLVPETARAITARLKISRGLANDILAAQGLWRDLGALKTYRPSDVVNRLSGVAPEPIYAAFLATSDAQVKKVLRDYVFHWQHISPTVDGHDLRARGLPPGPTYKQILSTLRDAWVDGRINSVEQERELLEKLVGEYSGESQG
jgi:tRNA nucleotidyltransferase (CCA-adding enzyme)